MDLSALLRTVSTESETALKQTSIVVVACVLFATLEATAPASLIVPQTFAPTTNALPQVVTIH